MSNYPAQQDFGPQYTQPPRQGSGCVGKLLGCCGITAVILIIICCGVGFYAYSWFKNNTTADVVEVQKISDEICTIKVPDGFKPSFAVRGNVPFFNKMLGKVAVYMDGTPPTPGVLVLIEVGDFGDQNIQEQIQKQLEDSAAQKSGQHGPEQLTNITTSTKKRKINNQDGEFLISEGTSEKTGKKKIRVNSNT